MLVRASKEDPDRGHGYAKRIYSLGVVALLAVTLVVGDDGQGFHRGARQAARLDDHLAQRRRQIRRSAELPAAGDFRQHNAAPLIMRAQRGKHGVGIHIIRQQALQGPGGHRLGAGEDHGLRQADMIVVHGAAPARRMGPNG